MKNFNVYLMIRTILLVVGLTTSMQVHAGFPQDYYWWIGNNEVGSLPLDDPFRKQFASPSDAAALASQRWGVTLNLIDVRVYKLCDGRCLVLGYLYQSPTPNTFGIYSNLIVFYQGENYGQTCPDGRYVDGGIPCQLADPKNLGQPCNTCEGNPLNAATGNKFQMETDYVGAPHTQLEFRRYYNSQDTGGSALGKKWHSTYHRGLSQIDNVTVEVTRADGRVEKFSLIGGGWKPDPDVTTRLTVVTDGAGIQTGWNLLTEDDSVENYALDGRLRTITTRGGLKTQLSYDVNNRLTKVTGPFGHALEFTYNGPNPIMTLPDGNTIDYGLSGGILTAVLPKATLPHYRQYDYVNTAFPNISGGGHSLIKIWDGAGVTATFTYDNDGHALSSSHPGGADQTTLANNSDGTVTATDAKGNAHTYSFTTQFGMVKPTAISGTPVKSAGGKAFTYDANGFIASPY